MEASDQALQFAKTLAPISQELDIASLEAARRLKAMPPVDAVVLIDNVLFFSCRGDEAARIALRAVVHAFDNSVALAASLRAAASALPCVVVASLLSQAEAAQVFAVEAAKRADAKLMTVSLGHLKTAARLTNRPDELARIATSSEPSVMREVLRNPRLTEALVVRMAARRPARPEPLQEIWKSSKWSNRLSILRALALNPYTPPFLSNRIAPLLLRPDWNELAAASELSPHLKSHARSLEARVSALASR